MFEKRHAKLIYLTSNCYAFDQEGSDVVEEQPDQVPRQPVVRRFDLICFIFAMVTYVFDIISDIVTGIFHYYDGRVTACVFILLLSIVPSVVLNAVSFAWICDDNHAKSKRRRQSPQNELKGESQVNHALLCLFQLLVSLILLVCAKLSLLLGIEWIVDRVELLTIAPLWWFYKAFVYGLRFRTESDAVKRRKLFCHMIEAERDATLLRFFEAFLESAPQLIIQGNILFDYLQWHFNKTNSVSELPRWMYVQLLSMALSLLSVCWSISIQHRSLRLVRPDKVNMHPHESVLQLLWRSMTIFSRFIVIVLSVSSYKFHVIPFLAFHFLISLAHIKALQPLETSSRVLEEGLMWINAAIHTFTPFNMADGLTRWRYTAAYTVEAIEAIIFFTIWLRDGSVQFPYKVEAAVVAAVSLITGLSVMIIYYSWFHPNRRRHLRIPAAEDENLQS